MTHILTNAWSNRSEFVFICMMTIIILAPVLRYVRAGWNYKRLDITNSLDDTAKQIYIDKFQRLAISSVPDAQTYFYRAYYNRFGRRYFVVPIALLSLVMIVASSLVVESIVRPTDPMWLPALQLNAAALAAMAGAYMWVVSDFIGRARRMDFSPSDVLWGLLRIVIAVPLGLAFSGIVEAKVLAFVSFGLGAFPLETIMSFLKQLSAKTLNIQIGTSRDSDLSHLDGVDHMLIERLGQEDITSVVQLAYCDPIQLTMRSNLSFNAVVDLMSQALAWIYIGDKLTTVRTYGFRGAYEFRDLCINLSSDNATEKRNAENVLPLIATALGVSQDQMWNVINEIAYDPYTEFIHRVWS